MPTIKILDCTLRNGGYCNNWNFGKQNISAILSGLSEAKIDYVECGYLSSLYDKDSNSTIFSSINDIERLLPEQLSQVSYAAMIYFGEYPLDKIPKYTGGQIKVLRIAFHKKDIDDALSFCGSVIEKGYQVFVQPMVTLLYTDEDFLRLIKGVNQIQPAAFYLVVSFEIMKRKDLLRLYYMVEHNLDTKVMVGYHSHNNMQLAYANAQTLTDIVTSRTILIDSTIYGMGRGAGNLNTELFVEYLNDAFGLNYSIKALLRIIDNILSRFYQQNQWGYSLPNYLSAKHNLHPNYATYLIEKNTLTYEAIDDIFSLMDAEKKNHFDKEYISGLYICYLQNGSVQENNLSEFLTQIKSQDVLLIAPGRSSIEEKNIVIDFISRIRPITFSINFDYSEYSTDYIFISNLRRFSALKLGRKKKSIVTSNIPSMEAFLKIRYADLLNDNEPVQDNAGLMLMKFLIRSGVKRIFLAGMDGYSLDATKNYAKSDLTMYTQRAHAEAMNHGMTSVISEYRQKVPIEFITTEKYIF